MTNKNNKSGYSCQSKCNSNKSNSIVDAETNTNLSSGCNKKDAGCNAWTSVAQNYNVEESCKKNEKDAGNNQWCSTCK